MVEHEELRQALAVRKELGPDYEDEIVDSLVAKVEKRLAERRHPRRATRIELGTAVPIVAVAGIFGGPAGVFVALAALFLAFLVVSVQRR